MFMRFNVQLPSHSILKRAICSSKLEEAKALKVFSNLIPELRHQEFEHMHVWDSVTNQVHHFTQNDSKTVTMIDSHFPHGYGIHNHPDSPMYQVSHGWDTDMNQPKIDLSKTGAHPSNLSIGDISYVLTHNLKSIAAVSPGEDQLYLFTRPSRPFVWQWIGKIRPELKQAGDLANRNFLEMADRFSRDHNASGVDFTALQLSQYGILAIANESVKKALLENHPSVYEQQLKNIAKLFGCRYRAIPLSKIN
jgi:hypothetical protein